MQFLAPVMLLGLAAAAIPIAIHLIGRRRAREVEFAAVDFLLGSDRKVARKLVLRDLLTLLFRVLVVVAIPLALAKPLTSCETSGPDVVRGPQAVVLVVDDSLPTRYDLGEDTIAERVAGRARRILDQLGPEAEIAIVRASAGTTPPGDLSRDHQGARDAIAALEPTARRPDVTGALAAARELLEESDEPVRTAYVISPLFSSGFRDEVSWPEDGPALQVVPVAGGEELENAAVTDLAVERAHGAGARAVEVTAELAQFGGEARRGEEIRLAIEGEVVARGTTDLEPGEHVRHTFLASMPEDRDTARVEVALAGDALAADDRRHVVAELQQEIRTLLVNGSPSAVRYRDELFYLRPALRPGDRGDAGIEVDTVTPDELGAAELSLYDAIVLANVPALSEERVASLRRWVEGGGGLLVTGGDQIEPIEYEQRMEPLLPRPIQSVRALTYGTDGRERRERALALASVDGDHPAVSALAGRVEGLLGARFSRTLLLGPDETAEDAGDPRVLARFDDDTPALVETERGDGRVALFASSIDRDWNDLAIFPGYPPLMQALVRHLGGARDLGDRRAFRVGSRPEIRVGARETRLRVVSPRGDAEVLEGDDLRAGDRARLGRASEPGVYRVWAAGADGEIERAPERDFAAHLEPAASDLAREEVASVRGAEADTGDDSHERRVELWHAIAAALLLFLLAEAALVWRSS